MHFCVLATRLTGGFSVPRKYGLNWFMPALAKSSVGSSCGTTGDDGTKVCPCFLQKKSMSCWRISFAVGIWSSLLLPYDSQRYQGRNARAAVCAETHLGIRRQPVRRAPPRHVHDRFGIYCRRHCERSRLAFL